MKDAVGGVFTLQAIIIALLIIMCLMAFAVNYSKAFRVKNEIRSIIEKSEGLTPSAEVQINEMIRNHQYFLSSIYYDQCSKLGDGWKLYTSSDSSGGSGVHFCIKCEFANNLGETNQNPEYRGAYYSIVTFVNIDVPIVNNLIPFTINFFKVSGETALIYSSNHNNQYCVGM